MGRGCGPMPNQPQLGGNMMVVCVHATCHSQYPQIANDVLTMGAGLIIGNFYDSHMTEYVASRLRMRQKVQDEDGEIRLE